MLADRPQSEPTPGPLRKAPTSSRSDPPARRFWPQEFAPYSIDQVSCRPDFAIPIFAGHMLMTHKNVDAQALRFARVPVALQLYRNGGHAFGVRKQGTDSDRWPQDALAWLKRIGMLP